MQRILTLNDELTEVRDNLQGTRMRVLCEECRSEGYVWVENEDAYYRADDTVWLVDISESVTTAFAHRWCYFNEDGEWYRNEPERDDYDDEPHDDGLLDYSANVLERCSDWDSDALYRGDLMFGVELEMEATGLSRANDLVRKLGGPIADQFILKHDGSLDDGVELVTVPMTLDQHRERFGWKEILAKVQGSAKSGQNTTNCGIHVHINKKALSQLVIGKMLVFLNHDNTTELVSTIAQRKPMGYCAKKIKKFSDGRYLSDDRYEALNVQHQTAEVRIFRGNLRPERVLKNIEFCHALVVYCRDVSMRDVSNPEEFLKWLRPRKKVYPELHRFLLGSGNNGEDQ